MHTLPSEAGFSQEEIGRTVQESARRAQISSRKLSQLSAANKNVVLEAVADALEDRTPQILAANALDLASGEQEGMSESLQDRLRLTAERVRAIAEGLRKVAQLADPIGEVVGGKTLPNGLKLLQKRVPLGVVGLIYEARPNVTIDGFGLAFKSSNAVLLRGSRSAVHSNTALVGMVRDTLTRHELPADIAQLLPSESYATVTALVQARGLVDVVIPRGGASLIQAVVSQATVPTIETGVGNCHVYIDATADIDQAVHILVNSKTRRPSVCNTAETLLCDARLPSEAIETIFSALREAGVHLHGIPAQYPDASLIPATESDWSEEYLSLDIAVAKVHGVEGALEHIDRWGTGHTEAIITRDVSAADTFTSQVDAAVVMVNASTAFTDGEQFGLGAEIGISTQKLHARGPMGLSALTSTQWQVWGDGQVRPA